MIAFPDNERNRVLMYLRSSLLAAVPTTAVLLTFTAPVNAQGIINGPFNNLGTQTLVPNGDFENALVGWGTFNSSVTFTASNDNPLIGTTSARGTITTSFTGPGSALVRGASSGGALIPGETYVLSAFINTSTLHPLAFARIDLPDIVGAGAAGVFGGTPNTVFAFVPFVATEPSTNIRFVVDVPGAVPVPTGSFATVDNVAITPLANFVPPSEAASIAPEPGSLALLALSGLPMIGTVIRRRRSA